VFPRNQRRIYAPGALNECPQQAPYENQFNPSLEKPAGCCYECEANAEYDSEQCRLNAIDLEFIVPVDPRCTLAGITRTLPP